MSVLSTPTDFVHNKLRGRIVEKYGTIGRFAKAANISMVSLSNKLNNKSRISREQIIKWSELLDISASEVPEYFFTQEV